MTHAGEEIPSTSPCQDQCVRFSAKLGRSCKQVTAGTRAFSPPSPSTELVRLFISKYTSLLPSAPSFTKAPGHHVPACSGQFTVRSSFFLLPPWPSRCGPAWDQELEAPGQVTCTGAKGQPEGSEKARPRRGPDAGSHQSPRGPAPSFRGPRLRQYLLSLKGKTRPLGGHD